MDCVIDFQQPLFTGGSAPPRILEMCEAEEFVAGGTVCTYSKQRVGTVVGGIAGGHGAWKTAYCCRRSLALTSQVRGVHGRVRRAPHALTHRPEEKPHEPLESPYACGVDHLQPT